MERRNFIKNAGLGILSGTLLKSTYTSQFTKDKALQGSHIDEVPYHSNQCPRSGIAHGGIGAGSIELRKDGNFYNWSIFNNYPLGVGPPFKLPNLPRSPDEDSLLFFLVKYWQNDEIPKFKLLQINSTLSEGGMEGITYYYPWMSSIDRIKYQARFPFSILTFEDDEMPFTVEMEVFSPFIPHDVKNSSLPGVYFNFSFHAKTKEDYKISLIASLRNLVGYDQEEKFFSTSPILRNGIINGFTHGIGGVSNSLPSYGEMGLSCETDDWSYYLGWEHKHPYYERLITDERFPNIDDTSNRNKPVKSENRVRGRFTNSFVKDQRCFSSIALHLNLQQQQNTKHRILFSWYFPNAMGSHASPPTAFEGDYLISDKITKNIGHYYSNFFSSHKNVDFYMQENYEDLLRKTNEFIDNFYNSSLPTFVLNQINAQLNTLITSSTLTKDGKFGVREGMGPDKPWGPNATMDVSLYGSIMILALFPELEKSMMRAHKQLQTPIGEIAHGLAKDMDFTLNGTWGVYHRLDLAPNYIQQVLRDYLYTKDEKFLAEMWPSVKQAMRYILQHRDKNKDSLPEMEGVMCSYDNFPMYGHAPYILSQWAACMVLVKQVAEKQGEPNLVKESELILAKTKAVLDEELWNGNYYKLSKDPDQKHDEDNGCLTDQIIGQWVLHLCGAERIIGPAKARKALNTIMEWSFNGQFLRNCTWPEYPKWFPVENTDWWVDQANTPWTGVELAFASLLMFEGKYESSLKLIKAVDDRYRKAGLYWNHQEFGGHYYRPLSAWSILHGALGFSKNLDTLTFEPKVPFDTFQLFFTGPKCTAHFERQYNQDNIHLKTGQLDFDTIKIRPPHGSIKEVICKVNGMEVTPNILNSNGMINIQFLKLLTLSTNDRLSIFYEI